ISFPSNTKSTSRKSCCGVRRTGERAVPSSTTSAFSTSTRRQTATSVFSNDVSTTPGRLYAHTWSRFGHEPIGEFCRERKEDGANELREKAASGDGFDKCRPTRRAPGGANQPVGGGPLGTTGRGVRSRRPDVRRGGS